MNESTCNRPRCKKCFKTYAYFFPIDGESVSGYCIECIKQIIKEYEKLIQNKAKPKV